MGDSSDVTIGGTAVGAGNLISGITYGGIYVDGTSRITIQGNMIGINAAGTGTLPNDIGINMWNSSGTTIGGTTTYARNIISGNSGDGIHVIGGASDTLIQGNYIGTTLTGTAALPNGDDGIEINTSNYTTVGGAVAGAGNLISGNTWSGVKVELQLH